MYIDMYLRLLTCCLRACCHGLGPHPFMCQLAAVHLWGDLGTQPFLREMKESRGEEVEKEGMRGWEGGGMRGWGALVVTE